MKYKENTGRDLVGTVQLRVIREGFSEQVTTDQRPKRMWEWVNSRTPLAEGRRTGPWGRENQQVIRGAGEQDEGMQRMIEKISESCPGSKTMMRSLILIYLIVLFYF